MKEGEVVQEDNQLMEKVVSVYQQMQTAEFITSMDKENWIKAAAWAS